MVGDFGGCIGFPPVPVGHIDNKLGVSVNRGIFHNFLYHNLSDPGQDGASINRPPPRRKDGQVRNNIKKRHQILIYFSLFTQFIHYNFILLADRENGGPKRELQLFLTHP